MSSGLRERAKPVTEHGAVIQLWRLQYRVFFLAFGASSSVHFREIELENFQDLDLISRTL